MTLSLCLIILTGCKKPNLNKVAGGTWNPNFAAPIGYADFDVHDLLAAKDVNDVITFDSLTGEMALSYRGEIASISAQSVLQLNNYTEQVSLLPTDLGVITTPSYSGNQVSSNNTSINFPVNNGAQLNQVTLESGNLNISVNTSYKHNFTLNFTFLDISINGATANKTISLNYTGNVPQNVSSTLDLANAICDFTANGTATNSLRVSVDATIQGTGQSIIGNENFDLSFQLDNLKFANATGYFGQPNLIAGSDSVLLKIFSNATSGIFSLINPKLNFTIENSFGIPITMDITNLKSINTQNGNTVNLINPNLSNLSINTPAVMGNTAITNIAELNNGNTTNMDQLVTQTPKYLSYTINAQANPLGNTPPLNFITKNSKLVVKADLKLPLEGYAYDFKLNDTLPFKFNQNLDIIESVLIRLNATNGFPIDFIAKASFVDSNLVEQFYILGDNTTNGTTIIQGAPVDNTGKVTSKTNKITDINLNKTQISKLKNVSKIIIYAEAATTNAPNQDVTIFDYYKLSLKLGIQTVLKQDF